MSQKHHHIVINSLRSSRQNAEKLVGLQNAKIEKVEAPITESGHFASKDWSYCTQIQCRTRCQDSFKFTKLYSKSRKITYTLEHANGNKCITGLVDRLNSNASTVAVSLATHSHLQTMKRSTNSAMVRVKRLKHYIYQKRLLKSDRVCEKIMKQNNCFFVQFA